MAKEDLLKSHAQKQVLVDKIHHNNAHYEHTKGDISYSSNSNSLNKIKLSVANQASLIGSNRVNEENQSPAQRLAINLLNSLDKSLGYSSTIDTDELAHNILLACKEQDKSSNAEQKFNNINYNYHKTYQNNKALANKEQTQKKEKEQEQEQDLLLDSATNENAVNESANSEQNLSIDKIMAIALNSAMQKHALLVSSEHGDYSYNSKEQDLANNNNTYNIPLKPKSSLYQENLDAAINELKNNTENKTNIHIDQEIKSISTNIHDNYTPNEHDKSFYAYHSGHMPCYFLYDYAQDQYLLDESCCRLLGITYTGEWMPNHFIEQQISIVDEDIFFKILFGQIKSDAIFTSIRIKQGINQGEKLYMTGSVIERDDTGIALLVTGYFSKVQANFLHNILQIKNHSSAFDIDTFTGEIHFGAGYKAILGLDDKDSLPQSIADLESRFIHPEDLNAYRKQNTIINNPHLGDYYESIYRLRHKGGYYIWCIDRGLVVERKLSGKASRVIGTTTNIDVVRSNFERLKRSIYQDPLTGLHNRLYLNTRYKYFTMEECQPLTLVYADISGLKVINDNLGHAQGDELVKLASSVLKHDIYLDHEVIRLSGDEFLIIFTNCSNEQCEKQIEKLVLQLESRNKEQVYSLPIYFGFGIATLNEIEDGDTFIRCEARADARLQEYKKLHHDHIYTHLKAFIENTLGHSISLQDKRVLDYLEEEQNLKESNKASVNKTLAQASKAEHIDAQVKYKPTLQSLYSQDIKDYVPNKSAQKSASVFLSTQNTASNGDDFNTKEHNKANQDNLELINLAEELALDEVKYTEQSLTLPLLLNQEENDRILKMQEAKELAFKIQRHKQNKLKRSERNLNHKKIARHIKNTNLYNLNHDYDNANIDEQNTSTLDTNNNAHHIKDAHMRRQIALKLAIAKGKKRQKLYLNKQNKNA